MKKFLFFSLIFFQIVSIIYLGVKILNKNNTLGIVRVNPIKKSTIITEPYHDLKFFFEPKPSISYGAEEDWIPNEHKYTINNDGLNERYDYPVVKGGSYRIITLGDSFTFGLYVNTNENWTELLEDKLNQYYLCKNFKNIGIINLGVPAYDVPYSSARYIKRGQKYNPDLVIWLILEDDFMQDNETLRPLQKHYLDKLKNNGNPNYEKEAWNIAKKESYERLGDNYILQKISDSLSDFGSYYKNKLLVLTFPYTRQKNKNFLKQFIKTRSDSYFSDSITNIYDHHDEYFLNDGHPTSKGHSVIANDIFQYLTNKKMIPCSQ